MRKCLILQAGLLGSILVFFAVGGCGNASGGENVNGVFDYRIRMVKLLAEMHDYARGKNPSFALMGNNGLALFMPEEGYPEANVRRMMEIVDGIFMEEYNFGWEMKDDQATPSKIKAEVQEYLRIPRAKGIPILNVDYCLTDKKMMKGYQASEQSGFIGFAADSRQLDTIPKTPKKIYNENDKAIASLKEVRNFLLLLNPEQFRNKAEYILRLRESNYDLLIIDLTFNGDPLTKDEIEMLKMKKNGGKRLVFSYMSVGEAENYRPYWQKSWVEAKPDWIAAENENWMGSYKVKYWSAEWKRLLYGREGAYLDLILNLGFDGAFLDVIDAFHYFEDLKG